MSPPRQSRPRSRPPPPTSKHVASPSRSRARLSPDSPDSANVDTYDQCRDVDYSMQDTAIPPPPPTKGSILDSHLQLISVLGEGGFSTVFLARSLLPSTSTSPPSTSPSSSPRPRKHSRQKSQAQSLFAIKLLLTPPAHSQHLPNPHTAHTSPTQKSLHLREISLHSLVLPHPSIVPLHKILFHNTYIALVMPYFPRGDLFTAILNDSLFLNRPGVIKDTYMQILDAVGHCHSRGVYMRDLKPENILVDYDPEDEGSTIKIYLTDFGLATAETESTEFRTGSVYHMSPECMGPDPYSPQQNDIWSLGILLLNLITSRNPWRCADDADVTFCAYVDSCNPKPIRKHSHSRALSMASDDSALSSSSSTDSMIFPPRGESKPSLGSAYIDSAGQSILLSHILPISTKINALLLKVLHLIPAKRPSVARLQREIEAISEDQWEWYSKDVVFESGCARCGWEVGSSSASRVDEKQNESRMDEDADADATLTMHHETGLDSEDDDTLDVGPGFVADGDGEDSEDDDSERISAPPSPRSAWSEDSASNLHSQIPPMPLQLSPNIRSPPTPPPEVKSAVPTPSPPTKSRIPRPRLGSLHLPLGYRATSHSSRPSSPPPVTAGAVASTVAVDDSKTPTSARPVSPSGAAKVLKKFHFKTRSRTFSRPGSAGGEKSQSQRQKSQSSSHRQQQQQHQHSQQQQQEKQEKQSHTPARRGIGLLFPLPAATPPSTSTSSSSESGSLSPSADDELAGFVSATSSFAAAGALIGGGGYPKTPKDAVFDPAALRGAKGAMGMEVVAAGGGVKVVDPSSQLSLSSYGAAYGAHHHHHHHGHQPYPHPGASPTSPTFPNGGGVYQPFTPVSPLSPMSNMGDHMTEDGFAMMNSSSPHIVANGKEKEVPHGQGKAYTKRLFGRNGTGHGPFGLFGRA